MVVLVEETKQAAGFLLEANSRASISRCSCRASHAQRHPDSPWSWLVCGASFLSLVIISGSYYCFGLLLPPLMSHFKQTRANTAWIGSLYLTAGNFLSPAISCLIDRVGFRMTAVLGGLLAALGMCLSSFVSSFWLLYITFGFLSGLGSRMVYNSSTLVVLAYFVKWRSVTVGIIMSAASVGMFVMTQATQALLQSFGWPGALRGLAALLSVTSLCACVFDPHVSSQDCLEKNGAHKAVMRNSKLCDISLFMNRDFVIFSISATVVFLGYFVPSLHMVKHCEQELGIESKETAMLYTYMAVASFVSRHVFCKLGDLHMLNRFYLYQFAVTVSGLSLLLCPFARSYKSLVAFFVIYGLMDGGIIGLFPILVLDCVGQDKVNQAFGFFTLVTAAGISVGLPLAGLVADKLGSYVPAFCAAGGVLLCGAVIMFLRTLIPGAPPKHTENSLSCTAEELIVIEKVTVI